MVPVEVAERLSVAPVQTGLGEADATGAAGVGLTVSEGVTAMELVQPAAEVAVTE